MYIYENGNKVNVNGFLDDVKSNLSDALPEKQPSIWWKILVAACIIALIILIIIVVRRCYLKMNTV